jgi:hypothetical protein
MNADPFPLVTFGESVEMSASAVSDPARRRKNSLPTAIALGSDMSCGMFDGTGGTGRERQYASSPVDAQTYRKLVPASAALLPGLEVGAVVRPQAASATAARSAFWKGVGFKGPRTVVGHW